MRQFFWILAIAVTTQVTAQQQYSFVFLHKKQHVDTLLDAELEKLMEGHLANIERLASEGKLLAAGPFGGGGGLFIMNSASKTQVEEWIGTDPGIRAQRWNVEILPYFPVYGGVCAVTEPYEMVTYTFARYSPIMSKTTASSYGDIMKRHAAYLMDLRGTGNVVTEANFGVSEGGIIVLRGDVQEEVLQLTPGVLEGLMTAEIRPLYIARGSFCEKK